MSNRRLAALVGSAALLVGGAGAVVANEVTSNEASSVVTTTTPRSHCEDWSGSFTDKECFAAGIIRYVSFHNMMNSAQFCKWQPANPGEWNRIKGYAASGTKATNIITWFGGSLMNNLEAYFVTGAPTFTLQIDTSIPNRCKTPLPAPVIVGVTPGQTTATVTVED